MDWNGQSVPTPNSINQALEKAERYWRGYCDYAGPADLHWLVMSATEKGVCYRVTASGRVAPLNNWWDRLDCTCPATEKGLRVCWHKAAAYLHYRDALDETKGYHRGY